MTIVGLLLEFRETQNPDIIIADKQIKTESLNAITVELLSWLKLERKREIWIEQGKKTSLKALELNPKYPWCNDLIEVLSGDNQLSALFCVNDNKLSFKPEISDECIRKARLEAFERYNPEKIVG